MNYCLIKEIFCWHTETVSSRCSLFRKPFSTKVKHFFEQRITISSKNPTKDLNSPEQTPYDSLKKPGKETTRDYN